MFERKKIAENSEGEEKEFVMPDAFCGCGKKLSLKPLTLYVICGVCKKISQIIRKDGGYIVYPYTKKKKLRPTLVSEEAPEEQEETANQSMSEKNNNQPFEKAVKLLEEKIKTQNENGFIGINK